MEVAEGRREEHRKSAKSSEINWEGVERRREENRKLTKSSDSIWEGVGVRIKQLWRWLREGERKMKG